MAANQDQAQEAKFSSFPVVKLNVSRITITWPKSSDLSSKNVASKNVSSSSSSTGDYSIVTPPYDNVTARPANGSLSSTLAQLNGPINESLTTLAPAIALIGLPQINSTSNDSGDENQTTITPSSSSLPPPSTTSSINVDDDRAKTASSTTSSSKQETKTTTAATTTSTTTTTTMTSSSNVQSSIPINLSSTTPASEERNSTASTQATSASALDAATEQSTVSHNQAPTRAPATATTKNNSSTTTTTTTRRWAEFKTSSRRPTTIRGGQRVPAHRLPVPLTTKSPSELDEVMQEWMSNHVHTTQRPYDGKRDCGMRPMQREGRVVGGRDSHLGEFPWSVLIRETSLLGFFVKTKCGGVLIDLKWVLTAAHCQPGMFGSLIVVAGEFDLSNAGGKSSDRAAATKPIVRRVKRMIIHRDYNPSNFDNDIGLLELESPFQVQPHVVPICLPDKDEDFNGQQALVAGWGKLSFGGPVPKVLQVAKLPVIGNKHCQEMYHNSGHMKIISDSFLCAGYENGGRDSCEGDSGGPLQVQRNDSRWVLAGTVSHGIKCAEPNLPGIYIRTAAYLPWIKAVTYHQDYNKRYGPALL